MLDFYLIKDEQPKLNSFKQAGLVFAGSLNEHDFEDLQEKKIIEHQLNFYKDFRWSSQQVTQKFTQLKMQ